MNILSETLSTL